MAVIVASILAVALSPDPLAAAQTVVEPPVKLTVQPTEGERHRGWLLSYDDTGFLMKTAEGDEQRIAWATLPSDRVMWVQEKVLDREDARGWLVLGAMLFQREDGREHAELALRRAVNADPALEAKAQRIRAGEVFDLDAPEPDAAGDGDVPGAEGGPGVGHGGGVDEGGPVSVGDVQSQFWGDLSDELMTSSIEELKTRMVEAQSTLNLRLPLYEDASDYFLFYSDLPPQEAKQWAGLLDQMYDRLCDIFDLPRGKNIFRGRGLIIVFQNEIDYHRYQAIIHGMGNSQGTAGLCRSFGDGHVEVTFFKQDNQLNFARVLVHEAVHAFNHRYRSYPRLDSWINEGLAEYVSGALVEGRGFGNSDFNRRLDDGLRTLREVKTLGGRSFFYADHIDGWQYPLAQILTEYMIKQDPKRYRAFINAIKDGKPWPQAIEEDYGVSIEKLVDAMGRSLNISNLRP